MKFLQNIARPLSLLLITFFFAACGKDSLESKLTKELDIEDIKTVDLLESTLNSTYRLLATSDYYGCSAFLMDELRSDNCLANYSASPFPNFVEFNTGEITPSLSYSSGLWEVAYRAVAAANLVISHKTKKLDGDPSLQKKLVGQAYALRALIHYDLLRFFGAEHVDGSVTGIPYISEYPSPDFMPERTSVDQIKSKLYADIDLAIELLETTKDMDAFDKVHMGFYSAHALRARIALWFKDWDRVLESTKKIEESNLFMVLPDAMYVQSWKSKENMNSIFELSITTEATQMQLMLAAFYRNPYLGDVGATPELKAIFTPGDVRGGDDMIGENFELKATKEADHKILDSYLANLGKYSDYFNQTDNIVLMRFEEVVLMKAEALFHLGQQPEALNTLNMIATNRGAAPHSVINEDAILTERRKELCFEGFRFGDLMRYKRSVPQIAPIGKIKKEAIAYGSKLCSFPIPIEELQSNHNIVQTLGY